MNGGTKVRVASYARASSGEDGNDQSTDQRPPTAHLLWDVHRERHLCREAEHRGVLATPVHRGRRAEIPSAPRAPHLCAGINTAASEPQPLARLHPRHLRWCRSGPRQARYELRTATLTRSVPDTWTRTASP